MTIQIPARPLLVVAVLLTLAISGCHSDNTENTSGAGAKSPASSTEGTGGTAQETRSQRPKVDTNQ